METEELLKMVQNLKELSIKNRENLQQRKKQSLQSSYKCTLCKDTGWQERKNSDGMSFFTACSCRKARKSKMQWKASGIDIKISNLTFSNFNIWNESSKRLKSTAIAYFSDFFKIRFLRHNSIIMCGQPGSGKTHIATALAVNFIDKGLRVVYMPYRDMITKLKQNLLDAAVYNKNLDNFKNCDLLLIDDLFKGKVTSSDINIIFEIVNFRYLNHLPMIVNSELLTEEILELDEGVGSRIYEMCRNFIVVVKREVKNNYRLR